MVVWTWTWNPAWVHSLSNVCPVSVYVESLSCPCPRQVQTMSTPRIFSMSVDRDWTSKSRVWPGIVPESRNLNFFLTGQTLDRGWTFKYCGQGSHFGLLKLQNLFSLTEIGQPLYVDRPWTMFRYLLSCLRNPKSQLKNFGLASRIL